MVSTPNTQAVFVKQAKDGHKNLQEHIKMVHTSIDLDAPLADSAILIKQLAFGIDPYMYYGMTMPPDISVHWGFVAGETIKGPTVGRVLQSNHPDYLRDDIVIAGISTGLFAEYALIDKDQTSGYRVRNDAKTSGLPLTYYLGILGLCGMTAYYGLFTFAKPQAGETMYVSSAAGGVGQAAGQFGKMAGLRVIGSAGSDEKVDLLKKIGYDDAFNYKTADWESEFTRMAPNGININFENVGGKMMDMAIAHATDKGRVILSGMVSHYGDEDLEGHKNMFLAITKRLHLFGISAADITPDIADKFNKDVTQWIKEGKVTYQENISIGIKSIPKALVDQLSGVGLGKRVVAVVDL